VCICEREREKKYVGGVPKHNKKVGGFIRFQKHYCTSVQIVHITLLCTGCISVFVLTPSHLHHYYTYTVILVLFEIRNITGLISSECSDALVQLYLNRYDMKILYYSSTFNVYFAYLFIICA